MNIYEALLPSPPETAGGIWLSKGVVTDIKDEENQNRVKVRLLGRSDSRQETDFIPVMTPRAGNENGLFTFPQTGDEVAVGFFDGDITSPFVLGSFWNEKRKAPVTVQDGKNEQQLIKTEGGHLFSFTDGDDAPGIVLQTREGFLLSFDDKGKTAALSDKDGKNAVLIDMSAKTVTVQADAKILLKAGNVSVELDGNGNAVKIQSSGSIKLSGQQVSIEGQSAVEIKASGQLNLEASGIASLKGSMTKIN